MSYNGKDVNLFTNGKAIATDNRLPVDSTGTVSISGTVPLPTGAATSAKQDTGNTSLSSIDGKLPALVNSRVPIAPSGTLVSEVFDYISTNYAGATTDVYTYKSGGSGGTTVATVTITYSDSTKAVISSVAKT